MSKESPTTTQGGYPKMKLPQATIKVELVFYVGRA